MKGRRTLSGVKQSAVIILKPAPRLRSSQHGEMHLIFLGKWLVSMPLPSTSPWYLSHMVPWWALSCSSLFMDWTVVYRGSKKYREVTRAEGTMEDSGEDSGTAGKTEGRTVLGGDGELSKQTHVDLHSPVNKLILWKWNQHAAFTRWNIMCWSTGCGQNTVPINAMHFELLCCLSLITARQLHR